MLRPADSCSLVQAANATVDSSRHAGSTRRCRFERITPERSASRRFGTSIAARFGLGFLWEWAKIFSISVVLFFVLRTFLVEAFKIPSGSMERTLLVGDFLLVNKLVYGAEVPFTQQAAARIARSAARRRDRLRVAEDPHEELREAARRRRPATRWRCATASCIRNGVASARALRRRIPTPDIDPCRRMFPVAARLPRARPAKRAVGIPSIAKQLGSVGRP